MPPSGGDPYSSDARSYKQLKRNSPEFNLIAAEAIGIRWPEDVELRASERDRAAPRLQELEPELGAITGTNALRR